MKKLLSLLSSAFVYFSMATTLAVLGGGGMFWAKGGLSGDRGWQLMAVLNGLDLFDFWTRMEEATLPAKRAQQMSYDELLEARVKAGLDWDMREKAIERAVGDLRVMEANHKQQITMFAAERQRFVAELKKRQDDAQAVALQDVQLLLDSLSPKQAKEQIKMWLENPEEKYPLKGRNVMLDMVAILKMTAPERFAKIAKEFKSEEETKMLHDILERIRISPEEQLIQQTKDQQGNAARRGTNQVTR